MIEGWPFDRMAPSSYDLIVADPPWSFRHWSSIGMKKSAISHYGLMAQEGIAALPVGDLAQRDCLLLLWSTGAMQLAAFEAMRAWGFAYKSQMIWRKTTASGKVRMGTGYWARSMHEVVLLGTRGKPRKRSAFPSLFDGVAREHSRKPDEFYHLVEKHSAGTRRADLFARESRLGYEGWGLESTKFDTRIA